MLRTRPLGSMIARALLSACLSGVCLLSACLPDDARPVPATLHVGTRTSSAAFGEVASADGWTIRFDKVLVALGRVELEGEDCNDYTEAGYLRILDARRARVQKVNDVFGLGTCRLGFHFGYPGYDPEDDVLIGAGVSEADAELMLGKLQRRDGDPYFFSPIVSIYVQGSASNGTRLARFDLQFQQHVAYVDCPASAELDRSGVEFQIDIELRPELLFLGQFVEDPRALRFQALFDADDIHGNRDGTITRADLEGVTLDEARELDSAYDLPSEDPNSPWVIGLWHYLSFVNLRKVARTLSDGSICSDSFVPYDPVPSPDGPSSFRGQ